MWQIILIILAVLYILNPFDILPDMMIGWGWLDDAVILGFLIRYFYSRKKKRQAFQQHYQNRRYNHRRANGSADNNNSRGHRTGASASMHWDPYRILEIEKGASQEEIKHAFRQLAGKYHPDKVEYLGDEFKALAEKRFKDIQQAYEELKRD
ncbi:MAG: DnaJ domain-containing protein [bacterium]|nr:DnaJ domain-containing protein [bacterium]